MGLANKQQIKNQTASAPDAISPDVIDSLTKALKHHKNEELKPAEKLYKKALAASKNHTDVALMVAIFYQQIGCNKYVITLLKKALLNAPHHFKVHFLLGKAYLEEKQYENALPHFKEAHIQDQTNPDVCLKFGLCLHRMGQLAPAIQLYIKAIETKNRLPEDERRQLYKLIADAHISLNQSEKAKPYLEQAVTEKIADYGTHIRLASSYGEGTDEFLQNIIKAFQIDPGRSEAKVIFAQTCLLGSLHDIPPAQIKQIIQSSLNSNSVNHQFLSIPWFKYFLYFTQKTEATQILEAEDFLGFSSLIEQKQTIEIFFDDFLYLGLKNILSNTFKIERLFTFLRKYYLLKMKSGEPLLNKELALLDAMAQHCFLNEYVFKITAEEADYIHDIKQQIEELELIEQHHQSLILIFACYQPLINLSNHSNLQHTKDTPLLNEIIESQIKNQLEEIKLQQSIKSLGTFKNAVSQKVKAQYEDNPYPRYKSEGMFRPLNFNTIDPKYLPEYKVLIAGCGTGKQILGTYNSYPKADFTAIDITKASLGYARRKLQEHSLEKKVKLLHCDILEVENLYEEFDHIECHGVLHHMENPLEGLKSLTQVLKPSGIFKLGLYSTLGRKSIFAARDLIKQQGFKSTPEGIRACREYINEHRASDVSDYAIHKRRDFYSLSDCRDLLFHVQEKCYDLLEIKNLLNEAGLSFQSFNTPGKNKTLFQEMFKDEAQLKDLECWAEFEKQYPDTFASMYQFKTIKNTN